MSCSAHTTSENSRQVDRFVRVEAGAIKENGYWISENGLRELVYHKREQERVHAMELQYYKDIASEAKNPGDYQFFKWLSIIGIPVSLLLGAIAVAVSK